jgi:TonB family protein
MTLRTTATIFAAASALLLVRPLSAAAQTTAPAAQDTAAPAASDTTLGDHGPLLLNPRQLEARESMFYPTLLRDAGVVGIVKARFTVTANGRVTGVQVLSDVSDAFADAARNVVRGLRYAPAVSGGQPVDAEVKLDVKFDVPGHPAS